MNDLPPGSDPVIVLYHVTKMLEENSQSMKKLQQEIHELKIDNELLKQTTRLLQETIKSLNETIESLKEKNFYNHAAYLRVNKEPLSEKPKNNGGVITITVGIIVGTITALYQWYIKLK